MPAGAIDLITESHEDRLSRMEGVVASCTTEVGKHGVKLEVLSNQVEEFSAKIEKVSGQVEKAGERMADKLDQFLNKVDGKIDSAFQGVDSRVNALAAKVDGHAGTLDALNKSEASRIQRKAWFGKIGTAVVTLIAGGLATKGVAMLLTFFGY